MFGCQIFFQYTRMLFPCWHFMILSTRRVVSFSVTFYNACSLVRVSGYFQWHLFFHQDSIRWKWEIAKRIRVPDEWSCGHNRFFHIFSTCSRNGNTSNESILHQIGCFLMYHKRKKNFNTLKIQLHAAKLKSSMILRAFPSFN